MLLALILPKPTPLVGLFQGSIILHDMRICIAATLWNRCKQELSCIWTASAAFTTEPSAAAAEHSYSWTHGGHHISSHTNTLASTLGLTARGLSGVFVIGAVNCLAIGQRHAIHSQSNHQREVQNVQLVDAADVPVVKSTQQGLQTKAIDAGSSRQKTGRFYNTVTVVPLTSAEDDQRSALGGHNSRLNKGYQLLLHKYPIKTPAKNVLVLPTYSLALAIAAEWEWLPKGKPAAHLMPLMSLAATALDQPRERSKVVQHLLKYIHTDSACIRYEPGPLQRRQAKLFDPLLSWAQQELGWHLHTTDSIAGTTQPSTTEAAVRQYLQGMDQWQLAAAEQLTSASKSLVIAAALLHGKITVTEAIAAARVEENFQLEDWGVVEAGHDLDIADVNVRIGAPALFSKLLSQP